MTLVMGAILGYDYGSRDERGNQWTSLSVTSDGFVIAQTNPPSSGAFVGSYEDLTRNVGKLLQDAKLDDQQDTLFWATFKTRVPDWRPGHGQV